MLRLASLSLVAALSVALFAFTGLGTSAAIAEYARILFMILLTLSALFIVVSVVPQKIGKSSERLGD